MNMDGKVVWTGYEGDNSLLLLYLMKRFLKVMNSQIALGFTITVTILLPTMSMKCVCVSELL